VRFGSKFRAFLPELFPGIEYLSTLSQQADWVKGTVEELNRDQKGATATAGTGSHSPQDQPGQAGRRNR